MHRALAAARDLWRAAETRGAALEAAARDVLAAEPLVRDIEYVSVADWDSMAELDVVGPAAPGRPAGVLSVAVRVGEVRLIDNLPLEA